MQSLNERPRCGVQEPRICVLPDGAVKSYADEAAEIIGLAGVRLDPWQYAILTAALGVRADDRWAAKTVDILCSRQNGKNVVLEARELFGAVILGEVVMHTAHEFKTAKKSFKRIKDMVRSHPDLSDALLQKYESPASGYSFEFRSGGVIEFIARSTGSGRGFTGDLLIIDEVQDLMDDHLGALLPALSATSVEGDPQVWYTGSAPGLKSEVWHRRRAAGRAGGSATSAYFEHSADPDADLDDRDAWAQANPGLGLRISEDFIEETERSSMSDEMFARERLSISPDLLIGSGVIPLDLWRACEDPKSGPTGPVAFALDVSPSRDRAAFAVAAQAAGGGTHVEVVDHRPGTDWCVQRAKELCEKWDGRLAVAQNSPAASLLGELEQAGVTVTEVSTAEHARACGQLYDAITQKALRHLGQPMLNAAVEGSDRKFYGDAWLWSRRTSLADISPLVAVTLAKWLHDQGGPASVVPFAIWE